MVLVSPPRQSLRRNFSTPMPSTLPLPTNEQPASSHESMIQLHQVSVTILTNQGIHLVGVLVENAVSYCSVSRPCCLTNYDIICRLHTTLHQARVRLLLIEFRFNRVRRRILASPNCQIDCVLLRQVHCHVRQIVHEAQVTHDRYCQSQIQFQHIQGMLWHSSCRLQHAERLHQLQRSCCVQTCQQLESTSLLLDRVGRLLSSILCQLQRPNIMAVPPPFHDPRQAADHPALLIGPENVQPFQVQTEEQTRDLVS